MNIKDVEQLTGMKKANIRYYEEEGLLTPKRNRENNYREYDMEDVDMLQKIKFLRVLGVSVKDIGRLIHGDTFVSTVLEKRVIGLEQELRELNLTRDLCRQLMDRDTTFHKLDVSLMDMQSDFIKMRGEKIMRLDKIHKLESYRNMFVRIWQSVFLLYYPIMLSLKLVAHVELPWWITLPFTVCALAAVAMMGIIDYRIMHYKEDK